MRLGIKVGMNVEYHSYQTPEEYSYRCALYEGSAQKGFGDPSLDGSPMPLGSTATHEPIEIPRSLWGRWKSLDATGML
jgi:hypothetical protein